eukprot:TRINITY_DN9471_c0_g1_i2.p1 TRINITY_DN9471_c0_g1~~TRINITY_DN9471_c0_g1_i2.p1  ORF type:complete len:425 (-),score=30.17 TRINITY_DN9471_c0_g1_i2:17-1291(-)
MLYLSLFFLLLTSGVFCKYVEGETKTDENWHFVSKFCFSDEGSGLISWTVSTKNFTKILLYQDHNNLTKHHSWNDIYKSKSLSCKEKSDLATVTFNIESGVPNHFSVEASGSYHFWFLVFANCEEKEITTSHRISFLNPGSFWKKQFSCEDQDLLGMYLAFFLFYLVGCTVHSIGVWRLYRAKSLHTIIILLTTAIILEFASVFFYFIHYAIYSKDGIGQPGIRSLAELIHMASIIVIMFFLILIAKGWTITSNYLKEKNVIVALVVVFMISYIVLFIWSNIGRDPASTSYFYDSVPGFIVVLIRILTLCWFVYCLWRTYNLESLPEKRRFYIIFGIIFTIWFISLPLFVGIAMELSPWWKLKLIDGLILTTNGIALVILGVIVWPNRSSDFFSFKPASTLLAEDISKESTGSYGTQHLSEEKL